MWERLSLRCMVLVITGTIVVSSGNAAETIMIAVRETAGILRPAYPVSVMIRLPASAADDLRFRMLDEEGSPIVAQFRFDQTQNHGRVFWIDFQSDLEPNESKKYTVKYGPDVETGPERGAGHQLTETETEWRIENAPYLTWAIPRNLSGLLRSLRIPPTEQLRAGSSGLTIVDRTGKQHSLVDEANNTIQSRVVREGPLAVALRFEHTFASSVLKDVRSMVDLHFPVSRSWVEVDWTVLDPERKVSGQHAELHLRLDEPTASAPTLVDFGATTMVYSALYPGQLAEMRTAGPARPAWRILRGPAGDLKPFFVGPLNGTRNAEGWAHVMDRKKCLALAISDFGRLTADGIHISAEGTVRLQRSFPESDVAQNISGSKRFRFWLHFVHFPPQHGAGTSPQAMQNPIEVRVTH